MAIGNACFESAFDLIRALDEHKLPWILENPHGGKCWRLPPCVSLENENHVHVRVADFCRYGTAWRKRTKFMCGNVASDDTLRLDRLCGGIGKFCGRTGKEHVQLTGKKGGKTMTVIAQPYPPKVCHNLAHMLLSDHVYNARGWESN